jgi:hypothetical protein
VVCAFPGLTPSAWARSRAPTWCDGIVPALAAAFHPSRFRTSESVPWPLRASGSAPRPAPGGGRDDGALAAASASSRRFVSRCSGCGAIPTSGRSDSQSTSSVDKAASKAETYAHGLIRYRFAPAKMLKQIAAVLPPLSLPTNNQFFLLC